MNLGFLTLGGAVGQTGGTMSTQVVTPKSLGYKAWNEFCLQVGKWNR